MAEKKLNLEKKILLAEAVLVFGALIYLFFSMSPTAISPVSGQTIFEPDFEFEIENGEEILISSTPDFENPIVLKEGSEVDLPPGDYYWKVKNWFREGEVRTFTIQSNVGLSIFRGEDKDILENSGNVDIEINKKKGGITTGIEDLDKGESMSIDKEDSQYEGAQNE